jgi:hypothetical protein
MRFLLPDGVNLTFAADLKANSGSECYSVTALKPKPLTGAAQGRGLEMVESLWLGHTI